MTINDAMTVLTTAAPDFSADSAAGILREHYGLEGSLKNLTSERDQNFHVEQVAGESYVLKIANSSESAAVTDFQTAALMHVAESNSELPVPRVVRTLGGDVQTVVVGDDGRQHVARLLTWLDGIPLRFAATQAGSEGIGASELGAFLARLGTALSDFEHPASDYVLLWDLKQAGNLSELLENIKDEALQEICRKHLQQFSVSTQPALKALRSQAIYNDLNPSNVLVDPNNPETITGIIDFGDLVNSPLVIDVAVAAAYLIEEGAEPLSNIVSFLRGYHQVRALRSEEIELLYDLVLTRSIMTIVITHWRATQYPANRGYILRNEPRARSTINIFADMGRQKITDMFLEACRL